EELFDDPACRIIFSTIKSDLFSGNPIDFAEIATHLRGETEITLLSELTLSEDLDDRTLLRIDEIIGPIERNYLDRRLQQLQSDIAEAGRAGDLQREDMLMKEKLELKRMLSSLK
ncbi:MAG TPA: hypothetical protein VEZ11_05575, partial [Thermoanaerobaculia bacterium]|nr:hypothetical protein [Thermoanaerobaculia bacterium]